MRFMIELDFNVPVGKTGDCYDRYLIRIYEMYESLNILKQCLKELAIWFNKN